MRLFAPVVALNVTRLRTRCHTPVCRWLIDVPVPHYVGWVILFALQFYWLPAPRSAARVHALHRTPTPLIAYAPFTAVVTHTHGFAIGFCCCVPWLLLLRTVTPRTFALRARYRCVYPFPDSTFTFYTVCSCCCSLRLLITGYALRLLPGFYAVTLRLLFVCHTCTVSRVSFLPVLRCTLRVRFTVTAHVCLITGSSCVCCCYVCLVHTHVRLPHTRLPPAFTVVCVPVIPFRLPRLPHLVFPRSAFCSRFAVQLRYVCRALRLPFADFITFTLRYILHGCRYADYPRAVVIPLRLFALFTLPDVLRTVTRTLLPLVYHTLFPLRTLFVIRPRCCWRLRFTFTRFTLRVCVTVLPLLRLRIPFTARTLLFALPLVALIPPARLLYALPRTVRLRLRAAHVCGLFALCFATFTFAVRSWVDYVGWTLRLPVGLRTFYGCVYVGYADSLLIGLLTFVFVCRFYAHRVHGYVSDCCDFTFAFRFIFPVTRGRCTVTLPYNHAFYPSYRIPRCWLPVVCVACVCVYVALRWLVGYWFSYAFYCYVYVCTPFAFDSRLIAPFAVLVRCCYTAFGCTFAFDFGWLHCSSQFCTLFTVHVSRVLPFCTARLRYRTFALRFALTFYWLFVWLVALRLRSVLRSRLVTHCVCYRLRVCVPAVTVTVVTFCYVYVCHTYTVPFTRYFTCTVPVVYTRSLLLPRATFSWLVCCWLPHYVSTRLDSGFVTFTARCCVCLFVYPYRLLRSPRFSPLRSFAFFARSLLYRYVFVTFRCVLHLICGFAGLHFFCVLLRLFCVLTVTFTHRSCCIWFCSHVVSFVTVVTFSCVYLRLFCVALHLVRLRSYSRIPSWLVDLRTFPLRSLLLRYCTHVTHCTAFVICRCCCWLRWLRFYPGCLRLRWFTRTLLVWLRYYAFDCSPFIAVWLPPRRVLLHTLLRLVVTVRLRWLLHFCCSRFAFTRLLFVAHVDLVIGYAFCRLHAVTDVTTFTFRYVHTPHCTRLPQLRVIYCRFVGYPDCWF